MYVAGTVGTALIREVSLFQRMSFLEGSTVHTYACIIMHLRTHTTYIRMHKLCMERDQGERERNNVLVIEMLHHSLRAIVSLPHSGARSKLMQ